MKRSALQKMNKDGLLELAAQRNMSLDKSLKKQYIVDALHTSFVEAQTTVQQSPSKEPSTRTSAKISAIGIQEGVTGIKWTGGPFRKLFGWRSRICGRPAAPCAPRRMAKKDGTPCAARSPISSCLI